MEAAEMAQIIKEQLQPLKQGLKLLEDEVAKLKLSAVPSPKSADPAPVAAAQKAPAHGLCEGQDCEPCYAQGMELANTAFAEGQTAALENLDQWLLMAAGEEMRQKIAELAARGQALYEASQQGVTIVA